MTRSIRIWTGRLIALGYLVCVLAPGVALALQIGPAPCLDVDIAVAAVPMTMPDGVMMQGQVQDHAMHMHHHADGSAPSTAHHHGGKAAPGPCCVMMCLTALPAALPAVVVPAQPVSTCPAETDLTLPGGAPPLLYRPPIRLS